ncbi:MAG: transposase zinc-binding domain-containing protein [Coprococcus phoceensis]
MNILQRIFTDYYEEIKYTLHPRKTEMENIDKMLGCGDPSFGGAMYVCTHCGNFKFVPFRCHSRFCPTCGNKYAMERTTNMSLNWSMLLIATVFLPLMKISVIFSSMTAPFLTVFFMQLTASFPVCFSNLINPKPSLPALSWFYIPLAETSNGILISIAFFQKVGLVMMASGVMSVILIILTFAMHSALHS